MGLPLSCGYEKCSTDILVCDSDHLSTSSEKPGIAPVFYCFRGLPIAFGFNTRQAVTELKIKGNTIPYIVTLDEIGTIYHMPFVRVSYSVTACRAFHYPKQLPTFFLFFHYFLLNFIGLIGHISPIIHLFRLPLFFPVDYLKPFLWIEYSWF